MPVIIDTHNVENNMYGVPPCPKCGSKYRWPQTQDVQPVCITIICDDCGFKEPGIWKEGYED